MPRISVLAFSIVSLALLTACDSSGRTGFSSPRVTYPGCLANAVAGASNRPVEELRNICAEAANVIEPRYKWVDGGTVPSDDFTRCYDAEKKKLEAIGKNEANRLAKLSCKYPEIK